MAYIRGSGGGGGGGVYSEVYCIFVCLYICMFVYLYILLHIQKIDTFSYVCICLYGTCYCQNMNFHEICSLGEGGNRLMGLWRSG